MTRPHSPRLRHRTLNLSLGLGLVGLTVAACGTNDVVFGNPGSGAAAATTTTSSSQGGASSSSQSSSSTGGMMGCSDPAECPTPASECQKASCDAGQCGAEALADGTACAGGLCKGGFCDGGPGFPCNSPTDCNNGMCTDGVCCDSACDGECQACNIGGSEGVCTALPSGSPDPQCGAAICDGSGCAEGNLEAVVQLDSGNFDASVLNDVAVLSSGDITIGGYFEGNLALLGNHNAGLSDDGLWARFDSNLTPISLRTISSGDDAQIRGVAVGDNDELIAVGDFDFSFDDGDVTANGAGSNEGLLLSRQVDGTFNYGFDMRGSGTQRPYSVVSRGGATVVVGYFSGDTDAGNLPLTHAGSFDAFIARIDGTGTGVWARAFGDGDDQRLYAVAIDGAGDVVAAGRHRGSVTLSANITLTSAGDRDALLVKFNPLDGSVIWAKQFGDAASQLVWAAAIGPTDEIVIGGYNTGTVDFGDGPSTAQGTRSCFVASFNSDGTIRWSRHFGAGVSTGDFEGCNVYDVAVDSDGNIIAVGNVDGVIDIGFGPLSHPQNPPRQSAFVAKFAPDGTPIWLRRYDGSQDQSLFGVTANPAGELFVVGAMRGEATYDVVRNAGNSSRDGLILRMSR